MTTNTVNASASLLDKLNPIPQETQDKFTNIVNWLDSVVAWFKNIKENIAQLSIDLMTWSFDAIQSVVLHTPLFLFDSTWFKDNIVTFTRLSIAMSIILVIYEGFQKILRLPNAKHTDMPRILKRIPLVLLGSAIAPAAFYYGFKGVNALTNLIIDIGKSQINKGLSGFQMNATSWIDTLLFIGFDVALMAMMIPVFLQNFRRWFDILALALMTPVVLSCWVFKAHEHHFQSWWTHLKSCSMTQLAYAVFLLIISTLMFGTASPDNPLDLLIKVGIVIGGLWRMNTPPAILSRYINKGANVQDMWSGAGKSFAKQSAFGKGVSLIKGFRGKKLGGATT